MGSFSTIQILKTPISTIGFDEAVAKLISSEIQGGMCCLTNVHTVTEAVYDHELEKALSASHFNFADGMPLVWASKLLGNAIHSRVCGPDLMREILLATPQEFHVFVGGTSSVTQNLVNKYNLTQTVVYSPPFRPYSEKNALEDWGNVQDLLGGQKPKFVWVGLGAPKQEKWMRIVSEQNPDITFFGVGAAFDFLSENKKRAPLFMQNLGLEWFFRFIQEPRRLWKRYAVTNTLFIYFFLQQFIKKAV